jgi:hypothetical protein
MPRFGLKPKNTVFEMARTFDVLDRTAIVIERQTCKPHYENGSEFNYLEEQHLGPLAIKLTEEYRISAKRGTTLTVPIMSLQKCAEPYALLPRQSLRKECSNKCRATS